MKKNPSKKDKIVDTDNQINEIPIQVSRSIKVIIHRHPTKAVPKKIHPRKALPTIKKGKPIHDNNADEAIDTSE